jgi:hypothetical protein
MGKVIIGIHGLGNKPSKDILSEWWKRSIMEGLNALGFLYEDIDFELVYWADVFYDTPLNPLESDLSHPLFVEEIYTPSPEGHIPETHPIRRKVLDLLEDQLDSIFLNEDLTINFSFITDTIIRSYFKELDQYYAKECPDNDHDLCKARDIIRERTAEVIRKHRGEEIFLIGHSMGSIISYDVLTFTIPEININTFVTIGSPLGLPVVMAKIAAERNIKLPNAIKLKTPPSVQKNWFNYSDLEDKIALIYDLSDDYDANFNGVKVKNHIVDNDYAINGLRNPHKSFGYLRTPELAGALANFLKPEKTNFFLRFLRIFRKERPIFHTNK